MKNIEIPEDVKLSDLKKKIDFFFSLSLFPFFVFNISNMSTTVLEKQHVAPSKSEKESISATDVDVFSPEEETYFKNQFYGVQKVILMKRLGEKWDKFLVVVG